MNESANHVFSLIALHEHLNSSHFPGSFGTIENPTLVSAILNDIVVGCGGGTADAERVPQQFHGADLHVGLRGAWAAWRAGIDLVDLDVNEVA